MGIPPIEGAVLARRADGPELEVVASAVRSACGRDRDDAETVRGVVDYSTLVSLIARTRTAGVVWHLVEAGHLRAPRWFRETLWAIHSHWDHNGAELLSAAAELGRRLEAAGVSHAFRKGAHLSTRYPTIGCRPFGDLDVLVAPEDLPAVAGIAHELGYTEEAVSRSQRAFLSLATNARPGFIRDGRTSVAIDLSVALLIPALSDKWAEGRNLTVRDVATSRADAGFAVLAPPFALADVVVNLYIGATTMRNINHLRFQRLVPYIDCMVVTDAFTADDWARLTQLVDQLGLHSAVGFALATGSALIGPSFFERWPEHLVRTVDGAAPDEYGALEFPAPRRWSVGVRERLFFDVLPDEVPRWDSPI